MQVGHAQFIQIESLDDVAFLRSTLEAAASYFASTLNLINERKARWLLRQLKQIEDRLKKQ